jgi:hypothetical protein
MKKHNKTFLKPAEITWVITCLLFIMYLIICGCLKVEITPKFIIYSCLGYVLVHIIALCICWKIEFSKNK